MAGFAASIYKRGIEFGFVPTTLLAMCDAAIGGKNGVNFGGFKNMIGTITQPQWVFISPEFLKSLPSREFKAGAAEALKTFMIYDRELASKVVENPEILGIMAIENTIAGSLLQNYRIIRETGLVIVGEYKLRIKHSLLALPGVGLDEISEVNSHPMALMQCADYLERLQGVKLVEKDDTAGSAKWIKEQNLRDHAAIAPAGAAALYGMDILADGIES